MIKLYLSRITILLALICLCCTKASAQYAISGTAGPGLYNSVYWLTWDPTASGTTMISAPIGASAANVINGTYVWQFSPTVRITAIVSNEVFVGGSTPNMTAYTPGNYIDDGLDLIYSANNQPKPFARGVENSALASPYGGQVTFDIDVKVAILINNVYRDIVYPGMVIADAESIDAGGEFISGDTPDPVAWQLLNKRTDSKSADDHYKMDLSNGGRSFKLYADLQPGNFGVQAVMFAHNARNLKNVSMKGSGLTAMAIGFVLPFDLGDDPSSYKVAGHYMDNFQITDYYPGDGTYAVVNYNTTPLVAKATVYIGADNVDPDGQPAGNALANNDDLTGNPDESTLNPATLPDIKVNQAGDIVLNLPVTNGKGVPATLYAWIDFNNDGVFSSDEVLTTNVPANTINQTFPFIFPNSKFSNKLKVGTLYTRFRITTTPLIDDPATPEDERSFSFAADGEAEDYKFKDILGVNISGTIFNDHDGTLNGVVSGTGTQFVSGLQLYAYLLDGTNTIVNKATVLADGTYSLANSNNGTYLVAISTNDVAIGGSISAVLPTLPPSWKPAGEAYGTNNAGHTGLEAGTPNLQIQVSTPGTSLDITGVNFALNQIPTTTADVAVTTINNPIIIDAPGNDFDPDGTLDLTKVILIDPADNVKKAAVTIAGQGTFTVNTTTGKVTFAPVATFTGKSVISYTIKDDYGSESLSATITVSVKPVGTDDTAVTPVGVPVTTNVKANDGASGNGNTVTAGNTPLHGTITVNASGTITYTPTAGYTGTDTYTYFLVTPDGVSSDPIRVSINVGNAKPVGTDDVSTTTINTAVTIPVLANDASAVGSTVAISTAPASGIAVVNADGTVRYTPASGFIGKDVYKYTLTNAGIVSDPITVTINVKPVGSPDADQTLVGIPVTTTVKGNDGASGVGTTVNAGPVAPSHGAIVVNADGTIKYTPAAGYVGTDTYNYTLTTGDGVVSDPIQVTIVISAKPVGQDDLSTTTIGNPVTTTVLGNDPSAAGSTVAVSTVPAHGAVTVNADGTIKYTPAAGYIGKDIYKYTLTNNGIVSDPITVTINIKPVGSPDTDQTLVGIPVTTTVKANDGASGVGTTVNAGTTAPAHGAIVVNALGTITYTPVAGYIGTDTYTYTLTTSDGVTSDPITVTITIGAKPTGQDDAGTTKINTPITTPVLANDPGATGSTVAISTAPAHGIVVVNADGTVTYTPASGYVGKDTYKYTLTNGGLVSDPITVTINVKPVGTADTDQTGVGTAVTTTVKANDGASGVGTTVKAGIIAPAHGAIVVNADGTIKYTPVAGYTGTDTYTYTLTTNDNVVSDEITVTITINPKPVGTDDASTTKINIPVITPVLANDASAVGSTVAVSVVPAHGAVVVNANGTITYTPASGFVGKDTYKYTLTNGGAVSNDITVTITVNPVGVDDADQTAVNAPVTTTVKANDGASGIGTNVVGDTPPAHGTIIVNANGTITYTPVSGYTGTDVYKYRLTTPDGAISDPVTVTITINPKPSGTDDSGTTPINTAIGINVTANDLSAAGATLAIAIIPAHGTVVIGPGAGIITYTPAADFIGIDTYTYTLTVNGVVSNQIKVTINVKPVGVDDVDKTPVNTPVTTIVKANDGPSGIGTQVSIVIGPNRGTVAVNASGTVTYTPFSNFTGVDTYTYRLFTADGVPSDPIKVTITVYTASMVLTKVANNTGSKVGDVINYTMQVINTGTSDLTNVVVTDAGADAGSITPASIALLPAGALATVTAIHTLTQADITAGKYSNQASVTGTDVKGNLVVKLKSDDPLTISTDDPTVIIIVVPPVVIPPLAAIKIPTLFTPNGDGINDVFEIRNLNLYFENDLSIVNRWGNEVFKQSGYNNTWAGDGLNEGTYYYTLRVKATAGDNWQVIKGYITLIRTFKK